MPSAPMRRAIAGLAVALALPLAATAQTAPRPTVDALVRSMTDVIGGARSFAFHVEKMFDVQLATGETVQYSGAVDVAVRRPDRLHVSYGDDLSAKEVWYDGAQMVMADLLHGVWGALPVAADLDATLDAVAETHDVRLPLAGLISSDAYAVFAENVETRRYIGLHDVGGIAAHHVLFAADGVQWQVWIDAGEVPLPLKLVVSRTDGQDPSQSIFLFSDWDLAADLPDEVFAPQIPEGAARAAFLPRQGE